MIDDLWPHLSIKFGMEESFILNDTENIHILAQKRSNALFILMIPGMFGIAEDCKPEFESLSSYSLAALSIRGRGKSSRKFSSYSFSSQVSDVIAVIDSCTEKKIILFAHSFGCLLAIAACKARKERIAGLILVDKGLTQTAFSEEWFQRVLKTPPQNSSVEIARQIRDEFQPVDLTDTFTSLQKPTLYFKGEKPGHALKEHEAESIEKMKHVRMVRLINSGHWPNESDYSYFISEIRNFVDSFGD